MMQAVDVLLEATPAHINVVEAEKGMLGVKGVASVHDLHVWTNTSAIDTMSVHVVAAQDMQPQ